MKNLENLSTFLKITILQTTTCTHSLFNRRGVPFDVAEEACRAYFPIKSIVHLYSRCIVYSCVQLKICFSTIPNNFCNPQNWLHPFGSDVLYIYIILPAKFIQISWWRCGEIIRGADFWWVLTKLAQALSTNTIIFLAFIIGDRLVDYHYQERRAAI